MLDKYVELKAKGLTPTVEIFTRAGGGGGSAGSPAIEEEWFRLTWTTYDPDTGTISRQLTLEDTVEHFVAYAKRIRTRWLAAKQIYEALKAETFPT